MNNKKFHEFLREKRMKKRITLREFCRIVGEDPSNYSKIERGLKVPPNDETLERYGKGLQMSGDALHEFITMGALFRKELPVRLTDEELIGKLPALLRIINGEMPTEEQLREAAAITREANRS
jgi:transcriptional regulator with XRE-family HTH domain